MDRKEFRRCIALIGDVHAEHRTLATALSILRDLEASLILCAGDITDGVGDVDACCALLEEHHVLTIAGNHDRWVLADTMRTLPHATERASLSPRTVAFLASLPATRRIPLPFGSGLLCHGLGTNDMSGVTPDDYGYELEMNFALDALVRDPSVSVVFNGHTHRRMVRHFDGLTIVNGGTLARRQDPGVVLVHAETHAVGWLPLDAASSAVEPLGTLVRNP